MSRSDRVASLMVSGKGKDITVVDGLRISFKVVKTKGDSLNSAKIEVYNLSKETRDSFSSGMKVLLKAGYANDEGAIDLFKGDVVRVYTIKKAPEVVTVIDALDGRTGSVTKISVGYPPGTNCKSVMNDLAKLAGFDSTDMVTENRSYKNGFSFTGLTKDVLTKVSKFLGAEWSIQNNTLKCISHNSSDNKSVQVLSVDTGLLGSPVKIGNIDPNKTSEEIDGWKVQHLLIPQLEPGNKVVIKSESLNAEVFSIASINHAGDTHGDEWATTLEVQEIKGVKVNTPTIEAKFQ